jgi:penicillin-binding protein 2
MNLYLDDRASPSPSRIRFLVFGVVVILGASTVTGRLFSLQVGSTAPYTALAAGTITAQVAVPSSRGMIYDRNGNPLVANTASYSVMIRPADLPESRRDDVVQTLGALLGMDPTNINIAIDSNPGSRYDQVRIAQDVDPSVASFIAESAQQLPGVDVVVETQRSYPTGTLLSQVLGYTGPINADELAQLKDQGYQADDLVGRAGVEATYQDQLRGTYGVETVEKDASGREIQVMRTDQQPVAGSSLRLTIDEHEQQLAQKALEWGMKVSGVKRGVIIVMNPQNGEILAMVSLPTYDDNQFAAGISTADYQALLKNPNKPLINEAISGQFPPGSTFKLVTGSGGLADNKITPTERLHTASYLTLGGIKFHDWNPGGFGPCDLMCGFGNSSDTYFYQVAGRLGIDRLSYYAHQYGFGAPTGVDLPNEASGIIPSTQWKLETYGLPVYPGEVYLAGIGQGYDAVTPLQLLNAYAALANGGTLYEPHVVQSIVGPDGVVHDVQPQVIRKLDIPSKDLQLMRKAARHVVDIGHTYNLRDLPIVVAGKTGTAEFGTPDKRGEYSYHTWFVAFVPKDPWKNPSDPGGYKAIQRTDSPLAVMAFAYDANTRGNVATEVVKYYLQLHYGIKKDYRLNYLLKRGFFPMN